MAPSRFFVILGTSIVLEYDPPLGLPESSLFPWIVTDAASWNETGQITIRVVMPDDTMLSTTLNEGAAYPVIGG